MPYYFSYDALIPDYKEEEGFYNKEELHCTLAYSKKDISEEIWALLDSIEIPFKEEATVTRIEIFNHHLVLLIDNPNLIITNKKLIENFSIIEDHKEKNMHVSIRKELKSIPENLKYLEDIYVGKKITLSNPKLIIKDIVSKKEEVINLLNYSTNKKLKLK